MENYTLNKIASDKANTAAKRADAIRVHIDKIVIVDGFNVREDDDDLREHIASLLAAMVADPAGRGMTVPVHADLINDLLEAVREMRGTHKDHRELAV